MQMTRKATQMRSRKSQSQLTSTAASASVHSLPAAAAQTTTTLTPTSTPTRRTTLSRAKLVQLVHTLATFRPKGAGEIQYYNFLREFCILNSCGLEESIERAPAAWRQLKPPQQRLYETEMRQVLPIPVPLHLVYDALRDERNGRLTLVQHENGRSVVESYSLHMHERQQQRLKVERKYLAFFDKLSGNANNSNHSNNNNNGELGSVGVGHVGGRAKCRKKRLSWQATEYTAQRIRRGKKRRHVKHAEFILGPALLRPTTTTTATAKATRRHKALHTATPTHTPIGVKRKPSASTKAASKRRAAPSKPRKWRSSAGRGQHHHHHHGAGGDAGGVHISDVDAEAEAIDDVVHAADAVSAVVSAAAAECDAKLKHSIGAGDGSRNVNVTPKSKRHKKKTVTSPTTTSSASSSSSSSSSARRSTARKRVIVA